MKRSPDYSYCPPTYSLDRSPYRHVRQRFWQRYRLRIRFEEYQHLCHDLATGRLPSILASGYPDETRVIIQFRYARRTILAAWDTTSDLLVTVLPDNARNLRKIAGSALS